MFLKGHITQDLEPILVEATMTRSSIALVGMELIRNRIAIFNLKTNIIDVK